MIRRLSRRRILELGAAASFGLAACGESPPASPVSRSAPTPTVAIAAAPPGGTVLNLLGWPFRPDLLRQRLDAFERYRQGIDVFHEQALRDYPRRAAEALTRQPAVDVIQTRDGLVGSWWHGGALRTLGTENAWNSVLGAMWPHARQAVTTNGQVVGLPYYADAMVLAYNRKLLDRTGASVPQTLDELTDISRAGAKNRIVEFGISFNLAPKVFTNLPWWGLVYASGGRLATPDRPDPAAVAVLEWLQDATTVSHIIDPDFTTATYEALALGRHMFSIVGAHVLRRLNHSSPGTFAAAPIPGITEPLGTAAWTPLYSVAANTPNPTGAADLVHFLGGPGPSGDYATASFWLEHAGLIPAYRNLFDRADVQDKMSPWIDPTSLLNILAMARPIEWIWKKWFLSWEHEMQTQVQAALFGKKSAEAALVETARVARDLNAS